MKRLLLLSLSLLIISSIAFADHIGIYTDAGGYSCLLAPGFSTTVTLIQKISYGSVGARFKIAAPAGSSLFWLNSPYQTSGTLDTDFSIGYGECLQGDWPLGQVVAIWAEGPVYVTAPDNFPNIIIANCEFVESAGFGGFALVGSCCDPCIDATEQSTWGKVKALYR